MNFAREHITNLGKNLNSMSVTSNPEDEKVNKLYTLIKFLHHEIESGVSGQWISHRNR